MHYYKFNIKDWSRDTAHLSVEEEGVYRRLLDQYYESEMPIPEQTQPVIRRLRLLGHEASVDLILGEFFTLGSDGYRHSRCDLEIEKYHSKAQANRVNGKSGGRPRKPTGNPDGSQEEPNRNLNQEPPTINQEQQEIKTPSPQQAENGHQFRFADIQDTYNAICSPSLPACRVLTDKRKRQVKRMVDIEFNGKRPFREHGLEMWKSYFSDCLTNKHWTGENDRGWRADFDFVTKPDNAIKLLERICG